MGLENATYISELDAVNPITATDPVAEGSNHLRLIKSVLQNTINFSEAVTLTAAQLNDAAIKTEANVFTIGQTISANTPALTFVETDANPEEGQWQFRGTDNTFRLHTLDDLGGAVRTPIEITRSGGNIDDVIIRSGINVNAFVASADGKATLYGVGETVAITESRANGGLTASDPSGVFAAVLRVAGDAQNINTPHQWYSNLRLRNDVQLQGRTFDDANWRPLLRMTTDDECLLGGGSAETVISCNNTSEFRVSSTPVARGVDLATGGFTVSDLGGNFRKAGFRNPVRTSYSSSQIAQQNWEGRIIHFTANANTLTIDSLEADTMYIIIVTGGTVTLDKGAGLTTLRFLDGLGGTVSADNAVLSLGSVVQVMHQTGTAVNIWGNGYTPA